MTYLIRLDTWLIDHVFQRLAEVWKRLTGYGVGRLATVVAMLWSIALSATIVLTFVYERRTPFELLGILIVIALLVPKALHAFIVWEESTQMGTQNPRRAFWFHGYIRSMLLVVLTPPVVLVAFLASTPAAPHAPYYWFNVTFPISHFFLLTLAYLMACSKPPEVRRETNKNGVGRFVEKLS